MMIFDTISEFLYFKRLMKRTPFHTESSIVESHKNK